MDEVKREQPAVLHVSQPADGGVGGHVAQLVGDQLARGWRVVVATPAEGDLGRSTAAMGAESRSWNVARSARPRLGEMHQLRGIVESTRPSVVHLHSSKAGLVGRLVIRGRIPTLFQPHAWSFDALHPPLRWGATGWERFATRWAEAIICVSVGERDRGIAHGIAGAFRLIPNGIDPRDFPIADEHVRSESRDRLGLGAHPLVVCVGRLSRQKGQDVLLESWPDVRRRVAAAELVLVGDGDAEATLRQAACPAVTFRGACRDVREWYAAADVVVMPSRWEGMSLVLLEAMASGSSLVVTDVAGAREALGDCGSIVPPEQPRALADAIVEHLTDPTRRQIEGKAAAERVRRNYDIAATKQAVADLYHEIGAF
jgi:glycosyltransferase involved in cell wall biosynthesis